jgi:hypothetical protein
METFQLLRVIGFFDSVVVFCKLSGVCWLVLEEVPSVVGCWRLVICGKGREHARLRKEEGKERCAQYLRVRSCLIAFGGYTFGINMVSHSSHSMQGIVIKRQTSALDKSGVPSYLRSFLENNLNILYILRLPTPSSLCSQQTLTPSKHLYSTPPPSPHQSHPAPSSSKPPT